MGGKLSNGGFKVIAQVLTGVVLLFAGGLGTTFVSSFAKASDTVSRPEVLEIVDREIGHVNTRLERIEGKLDIFLAAQGGG